MKDYDNKDAVIIDAMLPLTHGDGFWATCPGKDFKVTIEEVNPA